MITFVLLAAAFIAGILLLVLLPLWRRRSAGKNLSTDSVNVTIFRDQLRELDDDLAAGTISRERHAEARGEIERRLLEDTGNKNTGAAASPRAKKLTVAMLATVIPIAVIGLYLIVGSPQGIDPQASAGGNAAHNITPEQIEQMVGKLAARLENSPDDPEGWIMLGRSYAALDRFSESAAAYAQAAARLPDNAQLLVDYADVLGMSQGGRLSGEPEKLVQRALVIDPNNPKALALAGTVAFEQQKYAIAAAHWQKLVDSLPAGSTFASAIQGSIAEAQALAGGAKPRVATPGKPAAAVATAPAASVRGSVQISSALKAMAAPDDTVFIFARAVSGPPMPLAIMRKRVADLPLQFTLDDSMAMGAEMRISKFENVVIGARISRSGYAKRQTGDLEGFSKPVRVGSTGIEVLIDAEVR